MKLSKPLLAIAAVGLFGLAGWAMQKSSAGQVPVPNLVCEGVGVQEMGEPAWLDCVSWNCPGDACLAVLTETAHGDGFFCQCGPTGGPSADCCSLVYVPGKGGFTRQGDCNATGCNTSGTCSQITIPPGPTHPGASFVNCA